MTTPMQNKLLQALSKSVCLTDPNDIARQWPAMQQLFVQIQAAPFAFLPEGVPNAIVAFDNGRTIISNISYAISSGTELGAPTFIEPAAANNWLGFLKGRKCRNIKGEHAEVDEVGFWVLGREDQTLDLPAGTVFSYQIDEDGKYVISGETTNEPSGGGADVIYSHNDTPVGTQPELNFVDGPITWTLTNDTVNDRVDVEASFTDTTNTQYPLCVWVKAQHNWSEAGTISVKRLTGRGGSVTGAAFNAKLLYLYPGDQPPNQKDGGRCPIAYKGMELLCAYDSDGNLIVIDEKAYGPPLGTVEWQTVSMQTAGYVLLEQGTIDMGDADGGTFTLTFNGQTTGAIAWNASPGTVQTALEGLSNIGVGDVTAGGSAGAVTYTFGGAIDPVQPPLSLDGGSLTYPGGTPTAATITGLNITGWGPQDGYWNDETVYDGTGIDWFTDGSGNGVVPIYLAPDPRTEPTNAVQPGGGNPSHTHTVTITSATTGITVGDHPDHVHFTCETCSNGAASGAGLGYVISWADSHGQKRYTGGALAYAGADGSGHTEGEHTALTLSHSVTDPGHTHAKTVSSEYQLVNYKRLIPIERVRNSYEQLGV